MPGVRLMPLASGSGREVILSDQTYGVDDLGGSSKELSDLMLADLPMGVASTPL